MSFFHCLWLIVVVSKAVDRKIDVSSKHIITVTKVMRNTSDIFRSFFFFSGKIATFLNKLKIIMASTGIHTECNNYGEFISYWQSYNKVISSISSMIYCRGPSCLWARNFSFASAKQTVPWWGARGRTNWVERVQIRVSSNPLGLPSQLLHPWAPCRGRMDTLGVGERLGAALALLQGFGAFLGAVLHT